MLSLTCIVVFHNKKIVSRLCIQNMSCSTFVEGLSSSTHFVEMCHYFMLWGFATNAMRFVLFSDESLRDID